MAKVLSVFLLALTLLVGTLTTARADYTANLYSTEEQAQEHCKSATVVWLNTQTKIYHFKGQRWYGHTKSGGYVCQPEADSAGDRPTRNGE